MALHNVLAISAHIFPGADSGQKCLLYSSERSRPLGALVTVIPRNHPISVAFYDAHGDTQESVQHA